MKIRAVVGLLVVLTACNGLPFSRQATRPAATMTFTESPPALTESPSAPEDGTPPLVTATPRGPIPLRIWVAPQFDPSADTPAGRLLRARLDQFVAEHPGTKIEVRLKAEAGAGGLLESLTTASAAAPQALPDLLTLPRPLLESAAIKGLLRSLDTPDLESADWYVYARQLARVQNSTFGLPFAGDTLVLVYRPAVVSSQPPRTWDELVKLGQPLAFPVADRQALFPFTLYRSLGGPIQDEQGHPLIDPVVLTQVLTFTLAAEQSGIMPNWLTLYETYDQTWQVYTDEKTPMTVAWMSRYLQTLPQDSTAASLPTPDGKPFILASGWVWAVASSHPERRQLAVQLAEFLTEGGFLAEWCPAAGYLPPRSSALTGWEDEPLRTLINQTVAGAQTYPSPDLLSLLSPALGRATLDVFKLQMDPATAAQQAAQSLVKP